MALDSNRLQRLSAAVAAFNNRIAAVKQEAIEEAVQEAAATIPGGGGGGGSGTVSWNDITDKPSIPTFTVSGTSLYITT
jgi:hypothetical protein